MVRTLFLCAILAAPSICFGQIYKCTNAAGKISYQSIPCTGTKQDKPVILKSPTLTDREKLNAAAYAAGTTPEEVLRQQQAAQQGRNHQQQATQPVTQDYDQVSGAYRCTRVDGTTFVRTTACPKTASVTINGTTVNGTPAMGILSGRVAQESISKDQACEEAKQKKATVEALHRQRHQTMPEDFARKLEKDVESVCR